MVEAVQVGNPNHRSVTWWGVEWSRSSRNTLADALMGSRMIEVRDVFGDPAQQLPFAQNEPEVQALAAQTAEETLADCVRTGRGDGRVKNLDPDTGGDAVERRAIFAVIVMDEEVGAFPKRRRFPLPKTASLPAASVPPSPRRGGA